MSLAVYCQYVFTRIGFIRVISVVSVRISQTISLYTTLYYDNLKSYILRLYETNIIRLRIPEIYIEETI
jgi:hypothetical protein